MRFKEFKKAISASKTRIVDDGQRRHDLIANADGTDAISCLKQLQDLGLLNDLSFEATGIDDIENRNAVEDMTLKLRTSEGETKVYEEKRPWYGNISRKSVRHNLAAKALTDIAPHWIDQTFEEIKAQLL